MKLRRGDGHWTGNFQKPLFRKLRLYGDGNEDDVRYGELVMTMFMMVDEDGGCNDGGQPNFLPEKVKDSEARLAPPLLTQEIIIMIVVVRLKKVIKKVVSKPKNINRTLVNQESIIMMGVVMLTKVVKNP